MHLLKINTLFLWLIVFLTNGLYSQNFESSNKWLLFATKTVNQKGKSKAPPNDPNLKIETFTTTAWEFGIARLFKLKKQSYISMGLNYGWTSYGYRSPKLKRDYFPEHVVTTDYNLIGQLNSIGNIYDYWSLSVAYEAHLKDTKHNSFYVCAGICFRTYYPSSDDGYNEESFFDRVIKNNYINVFQMDLKSSDNLLPSLTVTLKDYIILKQKQRFMVALTANICPYNSLNGTYAYYPDTQSRAVGTFKCIRELYRFINWVSF